MYFAVLTTIALAAVLQLVRSTDWAAGEEIYVASSGFDPQEGETATIAQASGNIVRLEEPLRYFHFGAAAAPLVSGRQV